MTKYVLRDIYQVLGLLYVLFHHKKGVWKSMNQGFCAMYCETVTLK